MAEIEITHKEPREATCAEEIRGGRYFVPRVDISETAEELSIAVDMPGVRPGDVDIQYAQDELRIHGKTALRQPDATRFLLHEYGAADFYRAFRVGNTIDASEIGAELKDGVLSLHLPKKKELKPRRIVVNG